jgi:Carboxypeptidase regulatory-like domain
VVFDWQDARIIDASIVIEGKNFRRSLVADNNGEFRIALPLGTYKVIVKHPVFKTYVIKKLKVSEATNSALKVQLKVKSPTASGGKCPKGQLCL